MNKFLKINIFVFLFLMFFWNFISKYLINFSNSFFNYYSNFISKISSLLDFSLGDFFYIFLLFLPFLFWIYYRKIQNKKSLILANCIFIFNILYLFFNLSWGILYLNPTLEKYTKNKNIELNKLNSLCDNLINKVNETREKLPKNKHNYFIIDKKQIIKDILKEQKKIPEEFNFIKKLNVKNTKKSLFSYLLPKLGISGYFNPFTCEAQFDENQPNTSLIFTIAHENAHQMGIAKENDANFIAYIIYSKSKNIALNYSGNYVTLKYVLRQINAQDSILFNQKIQKLSSKVINDLETEKKYYLKNKSFLNDIFSQFNDWFLKFNNQEGIISYNKFVQMIIEYEKY